MLRFAWCSLAVAVLAGCPPRGPAAPPQGPQLQGAGCPSAGGVYLASFATQDPGKGRSGWVMPLFAGSAAGSDLADYTAIADATARAAGVPAVPSGNLWLVVGNAAPCPVKLGKQYMANIEGSPAYGIEVDGCPAPSDPEQATGVVLVSQDSPSGCTFQAPQPIASRLGEMVPPPMSNTGSGGWAWHKPEKETPIPPELSALVPQKDCAEPGCEKLWAVAEARVQDKPVAWAAAVNWLQIGDPTAPCTWKDEHWSGFFVPGADGAPVKVTEGTEHQLALSSVLVDHSGARVLLAEGPGQYATYDLETSGAQLGQKVTWMNAAPDEWDTVDHLGPLCQSDGLPPPGSP